MQNIKINPLIHPNLLNNTFSSSLPGKGIHYSSKLLPQPLISNSNLRTKFILNVVIPLCILIVLCFILKNKYMEKKATFKNAVNKQHRCY